jgi:hypothetical protein
MSHFWAIIVDSDFLDFPIAEFMVMTRISIQAFGSNMYLSENMIPFSNHVSEYYAEVLVFGGTSTQHFQPSI